jgi:hypothetical protein
MEERDAVAAGSDPTAIPMHVDPTVQRMSGRAYHGNTPFDVPYVSHVMGNLWQGGCADGLQLPLNIKHLVSLYPWEQYSVAHELASVLTVRMYDSTDGLLPSEQLHAIAAWVVACTHDGPTLVHCQAGLNRSSLVAGLALIKTGMAPAQAIALLRAQRSPACLCNPAFANWLHGQGTGMGGGIG